ncbi:MAG TPA: hypothetical protein VGC26_12115 [Afipia sp.]
MPVPDTQTIKHCDDATKYRRAMEIMLINYVHAMKSVIEAEPTTEAGKQARANAILGAYCGDDIASPEAVRAAGLYAEMNSKDELLTELLGSPSLRRLRIIVSPRQVQFLEFAHMEFDKKQQSTLRSQRKAEVMQDMHEVAFSRDFR